jgi:hypothetical protein
VTQDVGGLSELRWPSGSVIIQNELSVGLQIVCSNHKEQILTTEYRGLLSQCKFNTNAGGRKSAQQQRPDKMRLQSSSTVLKNYAYLSL